MRNSSFHFPVYGSALLSHCLRGAGFSDTVKVGNGVDPVSGEYHVTCTHIQLHHRLCVYAVSIDLPRVVAVLQEADALFSAFKEEPRKVMIF